MRDNGTQRFYKIIVALAFLLEASTVNGQQQQVTGAGVPVLQPIAIPAVSVYPASKNFTKLYPLPDRKPLYLPVARPSKTTPPTALSGSFYAQHLAFFCRHELQFEKTTSIPLRFRLGSVAYCDYLEAKNTVKSKPAY